MSRIEQEMYRAAGGEWQANWGVCMLLYANYRSKTGWDDHDVALCLFFFIFCSVYEEETKGGREQRSRSSGG